MTTETFNELFKEDNEKELSFIAEFVVDVKEKIESLMNSMKNNEFENTDEFTEMQVSLEMELDRFESYVGISYIQYKKAIAMQKVLEEFE